MKKFLSVLLLVGCWMVGWAEGEAEIIDVVITHDATLGKVAVTYKLQNADAIVTAQFLTNNVAIADKCVRHLLGDVNRWVRVNENGSYEAGLAWYYTHDMPNWTAENLGVKLSVWSADNPPDYMAVDVQAGTNITFYTSEDALPGGIESDVWRVGKILMRKIPAKGITFPMGKNSPDTGRIKEHQVTMEHDYYIGVFELTQGQLFNIRGKDLYYNIFQMKCSNKYTNELYAATRPCDNLLWRMLRGATLGYQAPSLGLVDDWSILGQLRNKSGLAFDLPTEAEWEFACRGGSENRGFYMDMGLKLTDVARTVANGGKMADGNCWAFDVGTACATARVGSYAPNVFGLYDMYGNVNELCLDHYQALTDGKAATDPLIGGTVNGNTACVARGGNCTSDEKWLTSAMRMGPNIIAVNNPEPTDLYGTRLAVKLPLK